MNIFLICVFIFIIIILVKYLFTLLRWRLSKDRIPGPFPLPIFANSLEFINIGSVAIFNKLKDYTNTYGDIYRIDLGFKTWVVISNPDYIEAIVTNDKFITKSDDYHLFRDWVGEGLITSAGKKWATHRKALTSAFHFTILEQFFSIMEAHSDILVEKIRTLEENETEFDIFKVLALFTLDVICETSMGYSCDAQNGSSEYAKAVDKLLEITYWRAFHLFAWNDYYFKMTKKYNDYKKCLKFVHDFDYRFIDQKRRELENKTNTHAEDDGFGIKKKEALLDVLVKMEIDGQLLTDEEIREEVDSFMFAGHDTTSTVLAYFFYNLAKYSEVQEKVCQEISEVFTENAENSFSMRVLNQLKYLDLVMKETLRLYPPGALIARKATEDFCLGKHKINKGESAVFGILFMHHNPKYFPDPEKFIPERFDRETSDEKMHPFAYIPFSAGYRNCIGQKYAVFEMKIAIVKILQNFKVELKDENYKLVLKPEGVLKTVEPIPLAFKIKSNKK